MRINECADFHLNNTLIFMSQVNDKIAINWSGPPKFRSSAIRSSRQFDCILQVISVVFHYPFDANVTDSLSFNIVIRL